MGPPDLPLIHHLASFVRNAYISWLRPLRKASKNRLMVFLLRSVLTELPGWEKKTPSVIVTRWGVKPRWNTTLLQKPAGSRAAAGVPVQIRASVLHCTS